jgi:undecaprenyl-diphosphatase
VHATLTYFQAVVMGLLQGVSELFPVSSLGHSVLIPALLGWHDLVSSQSATQSFFLVFVVGLHVGTAVGLIIFYRRTWGDLLSALGRQIGVARREGVAALWRVRDPSMDRHYRLLFMLVVATIPVGVAGLVFDKTLRVLFAKPLAAAIFLTLNGLVLLVAEYWRRSLGRHARTTPLAQVSSRGAFAIGSAQILALFAGFSRSGTAMTAGLLEGLDHEDAANFSFLLATPVILLAGLYKLPELAGPLGHGVRMQTLIGAACALVAAYASVRFLVRWFTTRTLTPFGIYSLVLGLICVVRFA